MSSASTPPRRWIVTALLTVAVLAPVAQQVWVASRCSVGLSAAGRSGQGLSKADPFSEADALRSGQGYAEQGFAAHAGLPDIVYGDQFPEYGYKRDEQGRARIEYIYTRYPPGPNWILGILTCAFGPGRIFVYRFVPLGVGLICLAFFAWRLAKLLSPLRALCALVLCLLAPMASNMLHGLHYQGYALSLILVQWVVLLEALRRGQLGWASGAALVGLGFAQGWLSFDYCFLVAFSAAPLWLLTFVTVHAPSSTLLARGEGVLPPRAGGVRGGEAKVERLLPLADRRRAPWKVLFWGVLAPGLGFVAAQVLHLWQVAAYLGGWGAAVHELLFAANYSSAAEVPDRSTAPLGLLLHYLGIILKKRDFFQYWLALLGGLSLVLLLVPRGRLPWPREWRIVWDLPRRAGWALVAALAVCSLWVLAMRSHAAIHTHFVPRHYFLLYFCCVLLLVGHIRLVRAKRIERLIH